MLKSGQGSVENIIPENLSESVQKNQLAIYEKRSFQFYQEGKFEDAIIDLNEAVKLNPASASGYLNNIAMCYLGLNNKEKAKEYFNKAIEKDNKNINAYGGLADVYLNEGNNSKAKEVYAKILSINPQDINAKVKLDSLNGK